MRKIKRRTNHKIILASTSPRRKRLFKVLLENFGLQFQIIPANINEFVPEKVRNYGSFAKKLALMKSEAVSRKKKGVIIGADTIVVRNGEVLGKPKNKGHAKAMLKLLSGKWHKVYTGISILDNVKGKRYSACEMTRVKFRKLSDKEIDYYIESNSPMDKAGAYGIQDDFGSTFVEKINGDYFNVVGLPIVKTYLGIKKVLGLNL